MGRRDRLALRPGEHRYAGIISAKSRSLPTRTTSLHPDRRRDQSGQFRGPLFNMAARSSASIADLQPHRRLHGLSFAVPIEVAMKSRPICRNSQGQPRTAGRHHPGREPELADSFGLKKAQGALVARSSQEPADKAGLKTATSSSESTGATSRTRSICRASSASRGRERR